MTWRDELDLVGTRELMRMRKYALQNGGYCIYGRYNGGCRGSCTTGCYTIGQINEILFDREHVPNKKEAKVLRREASKKGRKNRKTRGAR